MAEQHVLPLATWTQVEYATLITGVKSDMGTSTI